ncbi:MAG: DUF4863 family protein [Alphaproteobacteria bacterium]|jgi:hypothetical protein|nr:DUF4863 family protein [Alphaproteobacteria bacterium]HJP21893.1 DUF4863 family protein [Alphaproteobacteria bacterium]
MTVEEFRDLIRPIAAIILGKPLGAQLADEMNNRFPSDSPTFRAIEGACRQAIKAGWMCSEGGDGRRFGRVIEAGPLTSGLSVDVVDLEDTSSPHHRHPTGEICLIMPQNAAARFDGHGAGWCVFEPGSAHTPTVTEGRALVLYMLPEGRIEFSE